LWWRNQNWKMLCAHGSLQMRLKTVVVLTVRGTRAIRAAAKRQSPWINGLVAGLSMRDIRCALKVARALDEKLNAAAPTAAASLMRRTG
jgi:hypothetical protein